MPSQLVEGRLVEPLGLVLLVEGGQLGPVLRGQGLGQPREVLGRDLEGELERLGDVLNLEIGTRALLYV